MASIKNRVNMNMTPRKTSGQQQASRLEKQIQTAEYAVRVYTESGNAQYLAEWEAKLAAARAKYAELFETA